MVSGVVNSNYNELLNEQLFFILYRSCCANVETVHCQGFRSAADAVGFPQFNRRPMNYAQINAAELSASQARSAIYDLADQFSWETVAREIVSRMSGDEVQEFMADFIRLYAD
jgi:hypothetical protein